LLAGERGDELLDRRVLRHQRRTGNVLRRFVRVDTDRGVRVGRLDGNTVEVLDHDDPLAALRGSGEVVAREPLADLRLLAPIHAPEIWCAGVTYERSRDARLEEAKTDARDVYALVYEADRPELFMKDAHMLRTVGPGGAIRLRSDSSWMVPEPELAIVLGERGTPVAVTIGNDVSSRDIEGANPLYIPQAKIFAGACALGPALAVPDDWTAPFPIRLRIADADGIELFAGETSTDRMKRTPLELVEWVVRDNPIPPGSVLLTGTGLVPPDDYTLRPGHTVEIEIEGIGILSNTVAA
jgi:2-dehydro-3-deoxy-D-arabinonate dehydratase